MSLLVGMQSELHGMAAVEIALGGESTIPPNRPALMYQSCMCVFVAGFTTNSAAHHRFTAAAAASPICRRLATANSPPMPRRRRRRRRFAAAASSVRHRHLANTPSPMAPPRRLASRQLAISRPSAHHRQLAATSLARRRRLPSLATPFAVPSPPTVKIMLFCLVDCVCNVVYM